MSPENIRKLLGGYATGTLTTEEEQALFAAALEDQELFDALAREQSLRDLLRDPAARVELLGALDTQASRVGGLWQWLRRPVVAGLATAGVAAIALVAVWQGTRVASVKRAEPVIVAELKRPEPSPGPSVAPLPPPASQPAAGTWSKGDATTAAVLADRKTTPTAVPPRRFEAGTQSQVAESAAGLMKEKKAGIAMTQSPARRVDAGTRSKGDATTAAVLADRKTAPTVALPSRRFGAGTQSQVAESAAGLMKEKKAGIAMTPSPARQAEAGTRSKVAAIPAAPVADDKAVAAMAAPAPPPPPPAPAAMPGLPARPAEAEADAKPPVPSGRLVSGAVQVNPLDARALFYLDQLAPGANALAQSSGGGGAAPPTASPAAPRTDAPPPMANSAAGLAAPGTAPAPRLGVRVSILRGSGEVDLTTVLDPGETVRLKLIPNADGFLYVAEGARTVARGRAQRLQPFETPELRFEGSGRKQLIVLLSLRPESLSPQLLLATLARDNLVESSVGQERATYIVSGPRDAGAQEVVMPVTLTYR